MIPTEGFKDGVANVRSTCHWTIVAMSLRSQMLYSVELRAPKAGKFAEEGGIVN